MFEGEEYRSYVALRRRLRRDAAVGRQVAIAPEYGGGVHLSPDEADAIADVLEAAAESPRCDDEVSGCGCSQARLHRSLDRLAELSDA